jgi:ABC-type lipoprotein export system ATPase subunit
MRTNLKTVQTSLNNQITSINKINTDISNIENSITAKESFIGNYTLQIQQINCSVFESKAIEIQKKIDNTLENFETVQKDKLKLENDKFETSQWIFNFVKFKSFLAQKSLLVLQTKINEFLKEMKSDLRLKLEGFKEKADGKLKEKITPIVFDNGNEIEFGELSGGERIRVDQATVLTCQSIINETHPYGGLDLIWADEITEGLDSLGLKLLMNSMPKNKTILLTTHIVMDSLYENILTVENNNSISKIK